MNELIPASNNNSISPLRKSKAFTGAFIFVLLVIIIAVLAPVLSNNKPLYLNYHGHVFFPALSGDDFADVQSNENVQPERIQFSEFRFNSDENVKVVMPLIPFAPHESDIQNSGYKAPGDINTATVNGNKTELTGFNKHLMGTGKRGEDLLSGLIYGTRVSLIVGLLSMCIAGVIGIFLGALAGYFGDTGLKISKGQSVMLVLALVPAWFYGFQVRSYALSDALAESPFQLLLQLMLSLLIFIAVIVFFYKAGAILSRVTGMKKLKSLPVDSIISRFIEILISLPRLILILSIAAIARPSLLNLILIIGLTSWTDIARLTRAEMLKLRNIEYIESARSLGFKRFRIIFRHALPNAMAPAMVAIAFGIAASILTESSLSFLGIGVPQDMVTWGSLLAAGRENYSAWWLVVFPGAAIFLTVTAYNFIGEGLRDHFDPRLRK